MASAIDERALAERQRGEKWRKARRMAPLYVFLLFPMAAVFIFHYIPIYGVQIAFKEFQIGRGIWASPWAGFLQFEMLFSNPFFGRIMRNTVILSLLRIGFAVPAPLLLALLINEVGRMPVKRTIQSSPTCRTSCRGWCCPACCSRCSRRSAGWWPCRRTCSAPRR